ncbi:MAG: type VI secretion system baseplate subunit TssK [Planctomycetes bacterium]|nr:type VI secretion system baseplate subunit TssK [Planctomycetota bacterium]
MERAGRVLWHEGMFLAPQHFQQWDRWHDSRLTQVTRALQPLAWGITTLGVDTRALASQDFGLTAAAGIMPDGLIFAVADANDLPPARPIAPLFTAKRERLGVWLAAPLQRPGAHASSDTGQVDGRHTRWRRRQAEVADDHPAGQPREIAMADLNLRVLFEGESLDGLAALKIAEIRRDPTGGFALVDDYVAPCLHLAAAPALVGSLRRVVEILVGRAGEIARGRRSRTQGHVEFSVSEVASYLMLHTLNGAIPELMHWLGHGQAHPEAVFVRLASLAGQLATFSDDGQASDLPSYRHDEPMASFAAIESRLRGLLQTVIPTRYIPIPLAPVSERVQAGAIPDAADGARLYLSVFSALPAERVLRDVPHKAKVSSSGRLAALIAQALPGVRLTYLAVPPSEIPAQPGGTYFELERTGAEWDGVTKTRSLSIYLPPEFADARTEFLAIKD